MRFVLEDGKVRDISAHELLEKTDSKDISGELS